MSNAPLSLLDQAELLQLAVNASQADDSASAIALLKEAVSRADAGPFAHFLLGAEYAQIRMYDRAADAFEAAIALDPALAIARFQLGLLWLSGGMAEKAVQVLSVLEELPESDALYHFAQGLCHLAGDRLIPARAALAHGLTLNVSNPALNRDMQMLIERIDATPAAEAAPGATEEQVVDGQHILLSAYTHKLH